MTLTQRSNTPLVSKVSMPKSIMFKSKDRQWRKVNDDDKGKCLRRAKSGQFKGRCMIIQYSTITGLEYAPTNETGVPWEG